MSNTVHRLEQAHLSTARVFNQYYFHLTDQPKYIITSPNMNYLPSPLPSHDNRKQNVIVYWKHLRHIPDDMPHLAYLHKKPQLSGEIFG